MRKKKPYNNKKVYQSLLLITQFGLNMIVPIGFMSALGIYLDRRMETGFWTVLLFFIGALAGGQNIYRMARRIYAQEDQSLKESAEETEKSGKDWGESARKAGKDPDLEQGTEPEKDA